MLHVRLRRCCVALLAVSLALGLLMPSRGYAIEINWSGTAHPNHTRVSNGDGTNSFAVWDFRPPVGETLACSNGFDAAAWSMGTIGFDPRNLSALERAYLSDASFCPDFCAFAESFHNSSPGTDIGLPGGLVIPGGYAWVCDNYPSEDYSNALDEFNKILAGEYPSTGGTSASSFTLSCTNSGVYTKYAENSSSATSGIGWNLDGFRIVANDNKPGESVTVARNAVDVNLRFENSNIDSVLSQDGMTFYAVSNAASSNSSMTVSFLITNDAPVVAEVSRNYYGQQFTQQTYTFSYHSGKDYYGINGRLGGTFWAPQSYSGTTLVYRNMNFSKLSANYVDTTVYLPESSGNNVYANFGGGGGSPVEPTGPWQPGPTVEPPESPDVPEPDPPVSPEPDPPVVTQPTLPDPPSNPTIPVEPVTPEPEPTGTSPQDYTPWLRAILNALNRLDASLASHCQHLQQRMHTEMLWWYNAFTQWFNPVYIAFCQFLNDWAVYFDDLLEGTLDEQTYEIEQWLRELFVWLADQFEFTFTGSPVTVEPGEGGESGTVTFDDSSIVYWLKMIYNAIQDLDISPTTKPDIGSDANGFWEWLNAILAGIVAGLVAGILGVIAGFTDAIDALTDKFPFSLPWDIAAMLALLAHDPVTPVFDLPLASPDGTVVDCHVDMSDWNGVMANVRAMELLLFGLALAKRTPDMIDAVKDIF